MGRPVYEEPEYDVPAIGDLDMEAEFEFLRGGGSLVDCKGATDLNLSSTSTSSSSRRSLASSPQSSASRLGESFEDCNGGGGGGHEECIYENEGFRPFLRETPDRQCSREAPKHPPPSAVPAAIAIAAETPRSPSSSRKLPGKLKLKIDLNNKLSSFSPKASEESPTTPRSASSESPTAESRTPRDQEDPGKNPGSPGSKSACKPKPVVRPKPQQMPKASSTDKMDISTLRRQLRPTGQLKNGGKASKGADDSETASVISSEDSFSSQSTSDLSSTHSKGSRGGDFDAEAGGSLYRTTDPYEKVQDTEISFPAGVEVEVVERQESGWWYIRWGDAEGWAPTYYLEPVVGGPPPPDEATAATTTKSPGSLSKSNSLEKNEQRVQALNSINLKRATPPIPSKPAGGFSKPGGFFNGFSSAFKQQTGGGGGGAKQQQVVRPQSVYISAPMALVTADGPAGLASGSPRLRRNESLGAGDQPRRSSPSVRRHASFGPVHTNGASASSASAMAKATMPGRNRSGTGSAESLGRGNATSSSSPCSSSSSSGASIPVSAVRPKLHIVHNNLQQRELYVSIADYHGDEETMGFPEGTSLEVLERNPNGWWYCKVLDSGRPRKGWVPSNYLEKKH